MTAIMETLLFMLAVLAAVAVAAQRLKVAPSILLVVAGIGMALAPGLPKIHRAAAVVTAATRCSSGGRGLANDATALILYRFAVAAVATGMFSLPKATGTFALIVIGEILYGIAVGWLSLRLRQWAREPRVEIALSLMTPYLPSGCRSILGDRACWRQSHADYI